MIDQHPFFYSDAGGEVGETVSTVAGERWECPQCGEEVVIGGLSGYEHSGGYEDGDGTTWWLYLECPECEYQDSAGRVKSQIEGEN